MDIELTCYLGIKNAKLKYAILFTKCVFAILLIFVI
jgi:hypothetical protein